MNYLAHAFLSHHQEGLLVGNFIADHIRGNKLLDYPEEIQQGIRLHRAIDHYTDTHEEFKKCKRLFYDGFEKYSGILVDIYFDYFLASGFEIHSEMALPDFSESVYKVYKKHVNLLPENSNRFLNYVLQNNIYNAYAHMGGIEKVLSHLSHRINHGTKLQQSLSIMQTHETEIQERFNRFFHDIKHEFALNSVNKIIPKI